MSLLDVQRSLVGFARGSTREYQNCSNLTPVEHEWLKQLPGSPGLQVTQQVQQWWRINRVCATAPLTIALLQRNAQEDMVINYVIAEPIRTLFFAAELEQFKRFLHAQTHIDATTKSLVAFEAGIKTASQWMAAGHSIHDETFSLSLTFDCNPASLFSALLTGSPLPPAEQHRYQLNINPALDSLWTYSQSKNVALTQAEFSITRK